MVEPGPQAPDGHWLHDNSTFDGPPILGEGASRPFFGYRLPCKPYVETDQAASAHVASGSGLRAKCPEGWSDLTPASSLVLTHLCSGCCRHCQRHLSRKAHHRKRPI